MKKIIITLLITSISFNCFADTKSRIADENNGSKNVYKNGVKVDVMTKDKIYEIGDGSSEREINTAIKKSIRTGKKPVIVIDKSKKNLYKTKLRQKDLEDEIELMEE